MGFSGYVELLCEKGHYECRDDSAYASETLTNPCLVCGGKIQYHHDVVTTNGYDEDESFYSCDAPKVETGFTDLWKEDHYGNKYAEKHLTYKPDLVYYGKKSVWNKVKL